MADDDDGSEHEEPDDDELMGGVTFEAFYRDQLHAAIHAQPDPMLQALVEVVDYSGVTFDVTLFVNGLVVTGMVVGFSEWMDEMASRLEAVANGELLSEGFRHLALANQVNTSKHKEPEVVPTATPVHVHLRHATWLRSNVAIAGELMVKVRLSHVSAWTLGRIPI